MPTRITLALLLALPLPALAQTETASSSQDLRDVRYCELIVAKRSGLSITATVYNTLGLNDCPEDLWSAITEDQAKTQFDAMGVFINGPRYWVLDGINASGDTATGETVTIGGIGMTARATIELGLFDLRSKPYSPREINRTTEWLYSAGQPMFILQGPDGARYAMQSYSQIVDTDLSYADLPDLARHLTLPDGWSYSVTTPDQDLTYPATGVAVVVQDDLENTYQKLP